MIGLAVLAAVLFAVGGVFMKESAGLTRWMPTVVFFGCFGLGASCQALAMRGTEMGVVYLLVLGLEAVAAFGLSVWWLGESASWERWAAVGLIAAGIVLLKR